MIDSLITAGGSLFLYLTEGKGNVPMIGLSWALLAHYLYLSHAVLRLKALREGQQR
jgi:hypothetical protein